MSTSEFISLLIGIIGTIFGIWSWISSERKTYELELKRQGLLELLDRIHNIAGEGIVAISQSASGAADKALGFMRSIRVSTAKYSEHPQDSDLPDLIDKVLWSNQTINDFEAKSEITEIWLVTPDLKPDSSDKITGEIVYKNIMNEKTYVYFYPDDLLWKESEIVRLKENILHADRAHNKILLSRITLVALNRANHEGLFYDGGNIILYFESKNRAFPPRCFQEVVLTKISERGTLWQEHSELKAQEIKHELELELSRGKKASDY